MASVPDLDALLSGDRLVLARTLSQVEDRTPEGERALSILFPHTGNAHLIGITGSPGTGKSTLTSQLARMFRQPPHGHKPERVGILAIDPTSPFSGGAVLGDRVRMRDLAGDDGIFIRSMASRGQLGGLSFSTAAATEILDAAGYGVILIETVGAGQDDVSIASLAHTTIVVEAPDLGDEIQAIKAGILEIADILVLNKSDLPGVARAERALKGALDLADAVRPFNGKTRHRIDLGENEPGQRKGWCVPLVKTVAVNGEGTAQLFAAIQSHKSYLFENQLWETKNQDRLKSEIDLLLREMLYQDWKNRIPLDRIRQLQEQVLRHECSPLDAARSLLNQPK